MLPEDYDEIAPWKGFICAFAISAFLGFSSAAIVTSIIITNRVDSRLDSIEYNIYQIEKATAQFDQRAAVLGTAMINLSIGVENLETNMHEWWKGEIEYFNFKEKKGM